MLLWYKSEIHKDTGDLRTILNALIEEKRFALYEKIAFEFLEFFDPSKGTHDLDNIYKYFIGKGDTTKAIKILEYMLDGGMISSREYWINTLDNLYQQVGIKNKGNKTNIKHLSHPRICEQCGFEVSDSAKFCNKCGSPLNNTCKDCGNVLDLSDIYCPECGGKV